MKGDGWPKSGFMNKLSLQTQIKLDNEEEEETQGWRKEKEEKIFSVGNNTKVIIKVMCTTNITSRFEI